RRLAGEHPHQSASLGWRRARGVRGENPEDPSFHRDRPGENLARCRQAGDFGPSPPDAVSLTAGSQQDAVPDASRDGGTDPVVNRAANHVIAFEQPDGAMRRFQCTLDQSTHLYSGALWVADVEVG